jgi:hypothetical protein
LRTAPECLGDNRAAVADSRGGARTIRNRGSDEFATQLETAVAVSISEQSVVANADESRGKDVQQKATRELGGLERQGTGVLQPGVILPGESDRAGLDIEQTVIRQRDAVSVASQTLEA